MRRAAHALLVLAGLLATVPCFAQAKVTQADLDKKELAHLASLEKTYTAAKGKFTKSPKDAGAKKAYIASALKLANDTMVSPPLAPRVKYPKAIRLYREVLKVDPKNKEALKNKKLIEDIYKSMGRPVPQ